MNFDIYFDAIDAVLDPLLPKGCAVALVDFPNHSNVGDSAIWIGERAYLAHRSDLRLEYVCDGTQSSFIFSKIGPDHVILIHGGGNFGDLWPRLQKFREWIIQHYPGNRIIQLPQSIHFSERQNIEQCRVVVNRHPDFHLIVRDRESLGLASRLYDGPAYLCPDMAFCIGQVPRTAVAQHSIVGLMRRDREKAISSAKASFEQTKVFMTDWIDEPFSLFRWTSLKINWLRMKFPRWTVPLDGINPFLFQRLAVERFRRGCDILCSGEVVITDRLHGHIMCCLLGIPHVVLDNSYRKIGNFRDVWKTGQNLCVPASSVQEAIEKAQVLLDAHTFDNVNLI